jgi:hypothetical protein
MKLFAIAIAVVAGCATPGTTAPPRSPLAPSLSSLSFYVGEWDCRGTTFAAADHGEQHWKAKVIVAPELDGSWLSVQMIGPGSSRTVEHKGHDAEGNWVHLSVAPGGQWVVLTSPGWTDSRMVYRSSDAADSTITTFTKLDDHTYSHGDARPTEHGLEKQWEKVCSKRG